MMEEMIRRAVAEHAEQERKRPKPLPEAVAMELREAAKRYQRMCPFELGDLVTPAPTSFFQNKDDLRVVIDLCPPTYRFDDEPGSPKYGMRIDMRVLHIDSDGEHIALWVETASFDPWTDASAKPEPTVAADPVSSENEAFLMDGVPIDG